MTAVENVVPNHSQTIQCVNCAADPQALFPRDFARLYQEAKEDNRQKDEFLALVAHELRTPLSVVLGWTQRLRAGTICEATTAQALDAIERGVRAQAQVIEDLLYFARVRSGKLRLDVRQVNLAEAVEAAVNTMRPAADAKGLRLETIIDLRGETAMADAGRLQQVLWNLLSNAIKFTPRGGRVTVRLEREGTKAVITVSDTGRGMKPNLLPYLFERFRQADDTDGRAVGLGLGLAIVHHLVMLHGWTVQARSEGEGQGATFKVTLPLAALGAGETITMQEKPETRNRALAAGQH